MRARIPQALLVLLAMIVIASPPAHAKEAPPAAPVASPGRALGAMSAVTLPGVPAWQPPAQYSVDMVMSSGKDGVTMHRAISGENIRTEIAAEGTQIVMLELAREPGVTYNLMPAEKMAIKMNATKMAERAGKAIREEEEKPQPEVRPQIEKLGTEKVDGRDALKFKLTAEEHSVLAWFDAASGAPLRMESAEAKIEWKNLKVEPQPAKLFEVPKGYEIMDLDEKMKEMEKLKGAMGGMGGVGMPGGMPGGMGGMAGMGGGLEGMAGGVGGRMGHDFGEQIGTGIGASFGGPLGAMAGGYIGGKVGGFLGRRVATAVTPNVGPGATKK